MQNLPHQNEFVLHENEPEGQTHFHMNGFTRRLISTQSHKNGLLTNCAVPENIHTPLTRGIEISWGWWDSVRPKYLKKCMKPNWNFQWWGILEKSLPQERCGYSLELHIVV